MRAGRRSRVVTGGVLLAAFVGGCTTADPEPGAAPSPSPVTSSSPAPESVEITLGVYGPQGSMEAYDELAEVFTAEFPHVSVEVARYDDADEVVAAAGSPTAPDVFLMDHDHLPRLVEDALVQPVDGLLEARQVDFGDGYQRAGLTAFAADASLQCMPHDVSPVVVYYNEDLVDLEALATEDAPAPTALDGWRWDEFEAAARQASKGRVSGVYLEPSLTAVAPFVWSAGGDIVDDPQAPTTLTLSDETTRGALEQVLGLVRDPQVTPTSVELNKRDAVARFSRGQLAMVLGTRALTPRLREVEDLDFDVMPLPSLGRFRTVADMTGYCISAGTEEVEAAGDLLAFAVGREGATITARAGYTVPSNLEVANSAVFAQASEQPANSFIFNEGVRRTQSMPFTPRWEELTEEIAPDLQRLFHSPVIDLETRLSEIDEKSAEVLAPEEE